MCCLGDEQFSLEPVRTPSCNWQPNMLLSSLQGKGERVEGGKREKGRRVEEEGEREERKERGS